MADVRLTATNPEDSSVVPVACNAKGELLLEEPTLASDDYVAVTGDTMTGNLLLNEKIKLNATSGGAEFAGNLDGKEFRAGLFSTAADQYAVSIWDENDVQRSHFKNNGSLYIGTNTLGNEPAITLATDGSAEFDDIVKAKNYEAYRGTTNKGDPLFTGYSDVGSVKNLQVQIFADGDASFAGNITAGDYPNPVSFISASRLFANANPKTATDLNSGVAIYQDGSNNGAVILRNTAGEENVVLNGAYGSGVFIGDVVVGSRNKKWMLVESNGLCHMVEQTRAATADLNAPAPAAVEYPPLRDVFAELDAIEKALGEVMDKLRMAPPAGWEVWDGSSENS